MTVLPRVTLSGTNDTVRADILNLCPRCKKGVGQTYRVIPDNPSSLRILMRCDQCRHRWSAIVPKDSLPPDMALRVLQRSAWPLPS